jgi:hypothetical protein
MYKPQDQQMATVRQTPIPLTEAFGQQIVILMQQEIKPHVKQYVPISTEVMALEFYLMLEVAEVIRNTANSVPHNLP